MSGQQRIEDLIVRHLGDELSLDEQRELAALLDESVEARRLLASYMRIEGATLQVANAGLEPTAPPRTSAQPAIADGALESRSWMPRVFWATVACAALIGATILLTRTPQVAETTQPDAQADTPLRTVAELVRVVDAEWQETEMPMAVGASLPVGRLALASGLVEILFDSGASVILEGPAEFDLISGDRGFLQRGKLRGVVPPGVDGFTVGSAEVTVVDLGTEFGLQVDETGSAEVHVFDGEVEIHDPAGVSSLDGKRVLTAGSGVRIDDSGTEVAIEADETFFVGAAMLAVVADAYVDELQKQFDLLKQREAGLVAQIDNSLADLRRSPELVRLIDDRRAAEKAIATYRAQNPGLVKAEQDIEQAQQKVNAIIRKRIGAKAPGAALQEEVRRHQSRLAELKRDTKAARNTEDEKELARLRRERRDVFAARRRAEKELADYRAELGQNDEQVRGAKRQLIAVRKAAGEFVKVPEYKQLRKELIAARELQQKLQRRLLKENKTLGKLRAEMKVVTSQMHKVKRDIRDARQIRKG